MEINLEFLQIIMSININMYIENSIKSWLSVWKWFVWLVDWLKAIKSKDDQSIIYEKSTLKSLVDHLISDILCLILSAAIINEVQNSRLLYLSWFHLSTQSWRSKAKRFSRILKRNSRRFHTDNQTSDDCNIECKQKPV